MLNICDDTPCWAVLSAGAINGSASLPISFTLKASKAGIISFAILILLLLLRGNNVLYTLGLLIEPTLVVPLRTKDGSKRVPLIM